MAIFIRLTFERCCNSYSSLIIKCLGVFFSLKTITHLIHNRKLVYFYEAIKSEKSAKTVGEIWQESGSYSLAFGLPRDISAKPLHIIYQNRITPGNANNVVNK